MPIITGHNSNTLKVELESLTAAQQHIARDVGPRKGKLRVTVNAHRYKIGQMVYFNSPTRGLPAAADAYKIVRTMPKDGADPMYRIKSMAEAFERVAKESEITRKVLP